VSPTRAPWRAPAIQGALVELKGGDQYVRVEHVHVNDGGQAVIGNVKTAGSGDAAQGPALTPHANDPIASSAAYGAGRPSTAPAE
jgi:hypothetical protein